MQHRNTLAVLPIIAALPLAACASSTDDGPVLEVPNGLSAPTSIVEPVYVAGNPTCEDLGLQNVAPDDLIEWKFDPPNAGTKDLGYGNSITVTWTDGTYFDWESTLGIDAVIAKGGPNANVYVYDPEATSDTGLHAPINPDNGKPSDLSHITFCYDYEVEVEKTADTSYDRTYDWSIQKTGDEQSIVLAEGQTYLMGYDVLVDVLGYTDSGWGVSGTITVKNPAPFNATVTSVTDMLDGSPVPVDCGGAFDQGNVLLGPGDELVCTYQTSLPDGTSRTNVAYADATGLVKGGSGSAAVDFAGASVDEIDGCVDVTDDQAGALGTVCAGDAPKTYSYQLQIGPYEECGEYEFPNTASFISDDRGLEDSSSWLVSVEVTCDDGGGCSLTPGYWKTHSAYGPAPYDDTWAQLPNGADTIFALSGQSYHYVLWRPIRGNGYYILARAYIAAQLNGLNGSSLDAVSAEYAEATQLFALYGPGDVDKGKLRKRFIELAQILDDYNNGLIGPGHCSEDSSSAD
jgi:hypothetical protein